MSGVAAAQRAVFGALFDLGGESRLAKQLDSFITLLIVANLLALLVEHIPTLYATHESAFRLFDRVSIYLFTMEFVLRLFAAGGDPQYAGRRFAALRFAVTPFALIDLAVIAPYWLHVLGIIDLDLRALRALRLLRLLKLLRDFGPAVREFRRANAGRT